MTIKASEISFLIEQFVSSGWNELHVEIDGLHLYLSTTPLASATAGARTAAQPAGSVSAAPAVPESYAPPPTAAMGPPAATLTAGGSAVPSTWVAIKAPNLGTFYRSPKPGDPPLVEVGQSVSPQTEVCLLEVMKLFTAVRAGISGVVRRICVNDSEMVEHDQALMYVEPA